MKALLLAATSSLALTGFAMAQTATDATTTTEPMATAPAESAAPGTDATMSAAGTDAGMTTGTDAAMPAEAGTAADTMGTDATTDVTTTTVDTTTTDTTTTMEPVATETTDVVVTESTTTAAMDAAATTTLTADNPGMLGSWIMNRRIWTTNQPSSSAWENTTLTERPADWTDIAKVDDIVVDAEGSIVGYVADIGGFLGLGAKQVLLNPDALHFVQVGEDAFFATNYTREELEALPDFDTTTVMR